MGKTAIVVSLPDCQFPHAEAVKAKYDAKTRHGAWAYVCEDHFHTETSGELGTGKGQELHVAGTDAPTRDRKAEARAAILANDFEAFEEAVGDGDPIDFLM